MKRTTLFAFIALLAFSLMLLAGSCDVDKKQVKLSDLSKKLKKYQGKAWDGLKKKKVYYVVSGNDRVDEFSKQSALIYASLVQADHVSDRVAKNLKKLKQKKNKKARKAAEENLKIAQEILEQAIKNAPKVYEAGEDLVNNAEELIYDPMKYKAIISALKDALSHLKETIDDGPALVKKLIKQSRKLAGI